MCVYIGIEDLVANALIELVEQKSKRTVLFKELDEYGAMVVKCLSEKNEQAVLLLSKDRTNSFLHDYSDMFELFVDENGIDEGIKLRNSVEVDQLWIKFRCYLSADVMKAFMESAVAMQLGG